MLAPLPWLRRLVSAAVGAGVLLTTIDAVSVPTFLAGGGETGALIRAHDWAATPLGPPESWSTALKTAVALMLGAPQPVYLAWGPELTSLYNDGYLPILGSKHPDGLGKPCAQLWAEIWDEFSPSVKATMAGETLHSVDMPFALAGRGGPSLSYFTFSHTPLRNETGTIAGYYCAAIETTQTVLAQRRAKVERERLGQMFEQAPGFMVMLEGPEHRFLLANAAYRTLLGGRDVMGKTIREALPEVEGQGYYELLDRVYSTGEPFHSHSTKVQLARGEPAAFEERVLDFIYQPVTDADGQVTGIFVEGSDVTESHEAIERLRQSEARFRAVFENAGGGVLDRAVHPLDLAIGPRVVGLGEPMHAQCHSSIRCA